MDLVESLRARLDGTTFREAIRESEQRIVDVMSVPAPILSGKLPRTARMELFDSLWKRGVFHNAHGQVDRRMVENFTGSAHPEWKP